MRAAPLEDRELIAATIRHPRIYPRVTDDGACAAEDYEPMISPALLYLGMYDDDGAFLGLFFIHPQNHYCFEVHVCLLPAAWGEKSLECARLCIDYVFSHTECRRLVALVPAFNPLAKRLAIRAGLVPYGINPRSFLKRGELHDVYLLGISKGE